MIKEKRPGVMLNCSSVHYLVVAGCIGIPGVICGFVVPVPAIVVLMVPVPLIVAVLVMVWEPVVIVEPLFIVDVAMVEGIVCPPLEPPPMANAWVARAIAAITATVVNFFICNTSLDWLIL
jgi:hypothetical protein